MFHHRLILLLGVFSPFAIVAGVYSQTIANDELLKYLRTLETAIENVQQTIEITWYWGEGDSSPPENPEKDQLVYRQIITAVISEERYRVVKEYVELHPNLKDLDGRVVTMTWNGKEGRLINTNYFPERPERQSCRIENTPAHELRILPYMTWCGQWIFEGGAREGYFDTYADIFREVGEPTHADSNGKITRWEFPSPLLEHSYLEYQAERLGSGVMLLSATQTYFVPEQAFIDRDESGIVLSQHIEYYGNRAQTIPVRRNARLTIRRMPPAVFEQPHSWAVAVIRLLDEERIEVSDEMFLEPIQDDAIVGDMRFNIAYELGSNTLNVDGRLLETHIPLQGEIGERLVWWVENGKWLDPPPLQSEE